MNFDEELASAWHDASPPSPEFITPHRCDECDEIAAFFAGKAWVELVDVEKLRYHEAALSLFGGEAFHYYLPAFMRATLSDPLAADVIPDGIKSSIKLELGPASRGRLPLFTRQQRRMVARFLRMLPPLDLAEREEIEALAEILELS